MHHFRHLVPFIFAFVFAQKTTAQSVSPKLDSMLNHTLDSMRTVLGVKSLGASLQLPDNAVWAGAKGISSAQPLEYVTPEHAYEIGSITKTITAACILQLADEGLLHLSDSMHTWFDPMPFLNPNITIKQLLRHQSGLYDVITDQAYNSASTANIDSIWNLQEFVQNYLKAPLFAPGTNWSYSNTNYLLLGIIIEKATGNTYYDEFRSRFFDPLNMTSTRLLPHDLPPSEIAHVWLDLNGDGTTEDGHFFFSNWISFFTSAGPAGGYFATPSDVAVWLRAFLSGQLHSADIMTQAKMTITTAMPAGTKYGLGIMERKFLNLKAYGHGGDIAYSSSGYYFPEKDISIAVLNNDQKVNSWGLAPVVQELLRTYLKCQAMTGADDLGNNSPLATAVFPNPFVGELHCSIHLPQPAQEARLVLTNVLGAAMATQTVKNLPEGEQILPLGQLDNLPEGVYFLSVVLDGKVVKSVKVFK